MTWQSVSEGIGQARREMAVRLRRDISNEEIAEAVGVSAAAYSRWEKGARIPREDDVRKLAAFFGVTPAYLRYGIVDAKTPTEMAGVDIERGAVKLSDEEVAAAVARHAAKQPGQRQQGNGRRRRRG